MKRRRLWFLSSIFAILCSPTGILHAQDDGDVIMIGTTSLKLGMRKESVLTALGQHYSLKKILLSSTPIRPIEIWSVGEPGKPTPIGSVQFDGNNLLSKVGRDWTSEDKSYTASEVAELIYKLGSKFESSGQTTCSLSTEASDRPPGPGYPEFRSTIIKCGHRQLEIMLNWSTSTNSSVQVNEVLGDE